MMSGRFGSRSRVIERIALIAAMVPVSLFAIGSGGDAPVEGEASTNCTFDVTKVRTQRQIWRERSEQTELLAASGRRRIVTPPTESSIPRRNFIDHEIFGKMDRDGIRATIIAADEEFLRRVSLDLSGAMPDAATVKQFLGDTAADKRDKAIDRLLRSEGFSDRWTMWFGDLVQNVQVSTNSREYYTGRNAYYSWIRNSIRDARPYDAMVRELIAMNGDNFIFGPPNYVVRQLQPNGPIQDTYDNLAVHAGEKFLAMPLGCLSCHDGLAHLELVNGYLSYKKRSDFWKMSAFFSRTNAAIQPADPATPNLRKYIVSGRPTGNYLLNTTSGNKSPRAPAAGQSNQVTPAFFFTGEQPGATEEWRAAFGRMLTADPQFARATVNYLWKEMFGMGLIEPLDSIDLLRIDPATLPNGIPLQASHPQLLERLTTEFRSSGYNFRELLRLMAQSSAYQLSTRYTRGPWNEAWTPYFARHLAQRLPAEVILDNIVTATRVRATLPVLGLGNVPTAMSLPDPTEPNQGNQFGRFLNTFGRGNRDTVLRSEEGTIPQALTMLNDTVVTTRIKQSTTGSQIQVLLATNPTPEKLVEELYIATLCRKPSAEESAVAVAHLRSGPMGPKAEDLQFALLNKLEFLFN